MSLLERDDQLLGLEAALEDARQGMGATVLVSGEAGIGKSSLRAFGLRPRRRGLWTARRILLTGSATLPHRGTRRRRGRGPAALVRQTRRLPVPGPGDRGIVVPRGVGGFRRGRGRIG